jgi:DNA polymerase-3 subunit delta
MTGAALGYYFGDDGYGLDRAADAVLARLRAEGGEVERWRVGGEATSAARIAERIGTASLFGGGCLAVVVDPGPLLRSRDDRDRLVATLALVAPGNGLVFLEPNDGSNRRAAALVALEKAIREAGGEVREVKAPREGQLANWLEQQARERSIVLAPGAARELAQRIGGFVREGDVDRRRQSDLAIAELEKLGLYRPGRPVSPEDVRELVAEVVPGSTWAFLDAVAARRVPRALELLDRLLESTPDLVILAQLHRRIRELIEVADHLARGASPGSLVRTLKLKPFRAEKLVEQARTWSVDELDRALEGLIELDATVRGAPGTAPGDANRRLAWVLWITDSVARPAQVVAVGPGRG